MSDNPLDRGAPGSSPRSSPGGAESAPHLDADGRPLESIDVEADGDLPTVVDKILWRLAHCEAPVYVRGGALVRVVAGEDSGSSELRRDPSASRIVHHDIVSVCDTTSRYMQVRRRNRKTNELVNVDCPRVVAETLLSRKEWPGLRQLEAIVEHPVVMPDGEIVRTNGYHAPSRLLLTLAPYTFDAIDRVGTTKRDALAALDGLRELLENFPFVDGTDESAAIAYLLSFFARQVIPTCPAFAFSAHAAGSGKSTLVRTGHMLATGREPAFLTLGEDPAELGKVLLAALLEGDGHIAFDNIDVTLRSAILAAILTAITFKGRILGASMNAAVPTKAVFSFNGNNLSIVGDLTRRVLISRLDPSVERPAEREFGFDPVLAARDRRGEYVAYALTIMSAYQRGGDRVDVPPFGSFEEWSRLVREPLVWLGMADPVDSIRVLEAADPERVQLGALLVAVRSAVDRQGFKSGDLISAVRKQRQVTGPALDAAIQAQLFEALQAVCERNGELSAKALGRWFTRMNGRIEGGQKFVLSHMSGGSSVWRIADASDRGIEP